MQHKSIFFTAFVLFLWLGLSLQAASWTIDKSHSQVGFTVKHMVIAKVNGAFTEFEGDVVFDMDDLDNSKITGIINVASINTDNEKRDGHLRSADFFDAENFPQIKFESTKITKKGDAYVARGNLTIRDVTKEIDIPFTVAGPINAMGGTRIAMEGSATINRQEYNVTWNRTLDDGGLLVSDDVVLNLQAELIKK